MSASGLQVTGSTTVIASLVEHDDNQVKLKRSVTGKISTVPLDKLSLEDLAYVRRLRETTPSDDSAAPSHDAATETDEAASSFEPLSTGMSEVGVSEGWKTSERLLLAADTNRKEDETVWVNRDGTCVAHIEKRGEKHVWS